MNLKNRTLTIFPREDGGKLLIFTKGELEKKSVCLGVPILFASVCSEFSHHLKTCLSKSVVGRDLFALATVFDTFVFK